jgi:cold shock CspA family protein
MENGIIKKWNNDKKYGFVIVNDTMRETYFFHLIDCLYSDIKEGDLVTFNIVKSKHKQGSLCAVNLSKII